jgi:hypothetical protein
VRKLGISLMALAICCAGSAAVFADQLYIHNQPYKQDTTGSGIALQAQLGELVEAMGLKLTEVSDNWVISAPNDAAALPEDAQGSGKVYYKGKVIAEANAATSLVSVAALAEATGARLIANRSLGTVDLVKAVGLIGDAPKPSGRKNPAAGTYAPIPKIRLVSFDATW